LSKNIPNIVTTHTHNFLSDVIFANHQSERLNPGKYTRNSVFNRSNKTKKPEKEKYKSEKKKE
jgi:hypothetical protein